MTVTGRCEVCDGMNGFHEGHCIVGQEQRLQAETALEVDKAWRTHHDPGSAEEAHSRGVRFDKYLAMQQLLMEIAHCAPADNHAAHFGPRAQQILAGMQPKFREERPQDLATRAATRAQDLEALAFAYRVLARLHASEPSLNHAAAQITFEALQAWERGQQP